MNTHEFEVETIGMDLDNDDQMATLDNAPEDLYCLPSDMNGITSLSCAIEAESPTRAIQKLLDFLYINLPEVTVKRVVPQLVNLSGIAVELDLSRQAVRKWPEQEGFPQPLSIIQGQNRNQLVWVWGDVYAWALGTPHADRLDLSITPLRSENINELNREIDNCAQIPPRETALRELETILQRTQLVPPRDHSTQPNSSSIQMTIVQRKFKRSSPLGAYSKSLASLREEKSSTFKTTVSVR